MFSLIGLMLFFDIFSLKLFFSEAFIYSMALIVLSRYYIKKVKVNFLLIRFKKI